MSYIGVTGFTERNQVNAALDVMRTSDKWLMAGVLVSYKTLNGKLASNPKRYPKIEDVRNILDVVGLKRYVHYNTRETGMLYDQLMKLYDVVGEDILSGIQLNMVWPDYKVLDKFKTEILGNVDIVLQINRSCFKSVDNSCVKLLDKIKHYEYLVDTVLIDLSGGRGIGIDVESVRPYVSLMYGYLDGTQMCMDIGVAGGLGPNRVGMIESLIREFPMISIDAESHVRDEEDNLDVNKVKEYLIEACNYFKQ